ncbi:GNAT family N-acetyltransferase [Sporosarcina obsidiansis]
MIVDHTHVSDKIRGQGVGERLVTQVIEFVREESY